MPAKTSSAISQRVRSYLVIVSLLAPYVSSASTSANVCHEPNPESRLAFAFYDHAEESLGTSGATTNVENFKTDFLYDANDNWMIGFGHRTTVLNAAGIDLQTNGYLHTFFVPVHRIGKSNGGSLRFSIAPALSGSSNVTKDPDEYSADAWQLLAALVWQRPLAKHWDLSYGICGDHRFGDYRIYPAITATWLPNPAWRLEFGFPRTQVTFNMSKSIASVLRIEPGGNEWYVKDRDLQKDSQLVYESYVLEWEFVWRAHDRFELSASIGREFDRNYDMTLLDESIVRLSADAVTRIGLGFAWIL
jgi:hypothetical protein